MIRGMSKNITLVQLRIELRWIRPKVWRRVLVPESASLLDLIGRIDKTLHDHVIQDAVCSRRMQPRHD